MTYKYPNVDLSAPELNNPLKTTIISPFMAQFVDAIAMKYPQWLIQGYSGYEVTDTIAVTKFKVFDNDNPRKNVGTIGTTNRYHRDRGSETVYYINCPRLAMERDRGQSMLTKDLKQAMKAVKQYFTPPPIADRLDELSEQASNFARNIHSRSLNRLAPTRAVMYPVIQRYIRSNWDSFVATLEPAIKQDMEELVLAEEEEHLLFMLSTAINSRKVLTVLIEGDKYMVSYAGVISSQSSDELPDEIRRRIGMLKLTDEHNVIDGIGIKINSGGFVVIPPENFSLNK
jgi:hypothetical protein